MPEEEQPRRIRVAAVNDYELVVVGLAALLGQYDDRLEVVDAVLVGESIDGEVDVALYDTYGRERLGIDALRWLLAQPNVHHTAIFSLDLAPELVDDGRNAGATGFISKSLTGPEIADALIDIAAGKEVIAGAPGVEPSDPADERLNWPGRIDGLTERESEVLVLMGRGLTNAEIATALYIGTETVKTHVRRVLAKLDLRNRSQAGAYVERSNAFSQRHARRP